MLLWKALLGLAGLYALFLVTGSLYFYFNILHRRKNQPLAETPQTTDPFNWREHQELAQAGLDVLALLPREEVSIRSFDGLTLRGHLYPVEGAKRSFLLVHGYRSSGYNDFNAQAVYYMERFKSNVLIIDQRAHGTSEGKRIDFGVSERFDVQKWTQFLYDRFGADTEIFLNGISMGCASVLLAAELPLPPVVRGIIADCGYTSPWDEFAYLIQRDVKMPVRPLLPMTERMTKWFAHWDFRTVTPQKAVAHGRIPVLFIHGDADRFVPAFMSVNNHKACAAEKELLLIRGAEHAQSYFVDTCAVQEAVDRFVRRYTVHTQ